MHKDAQLEPGTVAELTRALSWDAPRGAQVIVRRLITRIEWVSGERDALYAIELSGKQ